MEVCLHRRLRQEAALLACELDCCHGMLFRRLQRTLYGGERAHDGGAG
jgi:hypothetical protein